MKLENQRHLFDIDPDVTYLNNAAQSPSLLASQAAGERGLQRKLHPWSPDRDNLNEEMETTRQLFAQLIGATADDIALMTATSYGAAIAAQNLSIDPGQEVLTFAGQFPSNLYAWQILAARDNGHMRMVERPQDGNWTNAILHSISDRTGLIAIEPCHWTDGGLIDLKAISNKAHQHGARLFVDATQAIGVMPFDVTMIRPDFVACSAFKWLLSPDAIGYLYVAPHQQSGRPFENNHGTRIQETNMESGDGYGRKYIPTARRFDQGASDNMVQIPMTVAALDQINRWGVENIAQTLEDLTDLISDEAEQRGFSVPPKNHRVQHMIGFRHPDLPMDLAQTLKQHRIYCSLRAGALRLSPYLFNDRADIARLFDIVDQTLIR